MTSVGYATETTWEEWCLDEFLLKPGSKGAVDCIEITDEDLLDFVGSDDLIEAALAFAGSLGQPAALKRVLSGSGEPPMLGARPFYVRILVFACWVQVTSLRERGQREFRNLLSSRLDWNVPSDLSGLPRMWCKLRDWLESEWKVDLRLPALGNQKQIGHTIRLPFPTWRDLDALRVVRDALPTNYLDMRMVVADRISTVGSEEKRSPAFSRKFQEWERAVRIADPGLCDLAFDRVWMRVVAEKIGGSNVTVAEDDFGDLRLSLIDVRGAIRETLVLSDEDVASLMPSVGRAARKGSIWMASAGFGRWIGTDDREIATAQLLSDVLLEGIERRDLSRPTPVGNSGWLLVRGAGPALLLEPKETRAAAGPAARRIDGIRVGAALLGRAPMTPRYAVASTGTFAFRIGGNQVAPTRREGHLGLPDGVWSGEIKLMGDGHVLDVLRLVPDATEHPDGSLKTYDASFAASEDGPLFGTEPTSGPFAVFRYEGPKLEHVSRMLALEEAVYARCRRSLPLGELARLAARATEDLSDAPSPWDVLRAFIDGGWLEPAATRKAAGRLLVPREPCFREAHEGGRRLFLLDGAAAGAFRRRVLACAEAVGLNAEEVHGIGGWSPPLVIVDVGEDEAAATKLLSRTGLRARTEAAISSLPSNRWREIASTVGYETSAVWNQDEAWFGGGASQSGLPVADGPALSKMDRPRLDQPPVYVIRHGPDEEILLSPVLALLRHAERARAFPYMRSGRLLLRVLRRHHLPAAWGRWLSQRALTPAGPFRTVRGWTYAYPADSGAVRALIRLCRIARDAKTPAWIEPIAVSRRDDLPTTAHSGTVLRPRVGQLR